MTDRTGPHPTGAAESARPVRTCIGCRRADSRSALLRVVRDQEASGIPTLVPDPRHRRPGRGAWLHPRSDCLQQALRRSAFRRALRLTGQCDVDEVIAFVESLDGNGAQQEKKQLTNTPPTNEAG